MFIPFARKLAEKIEENLIINPVCKAFSCIDIKNFLADDEDIDAGFLRSSLDVILEHYGSPRRARSLVEDFDVEIKQWEPIINRSEAEQEYGPYLEFVKKFRQDYKAKNKTEIDACKFKLANITKHINTQRDKRKKTRLVDQIKALSEKEISLPDVYIKLREPEFEILMPNLKRIVYLANLSPVSNAVVERLFSLLKRKPT